MRSLSAAADWRTAISRRSGSRQVYRAHSPAGGVSTGRLRRGFGGAGKAALIRWIRRTLPERLRSKLQTSCGREKKHCWRWAAFSREYHGAGSIPVRNVRTPAMWTGKSAGASDRPEMETPVRTVQSGACAGDGKILIILVYDYYDKESDRQRRSRGSASMII